MTANRHICAISTALLLGLAVAEARGEGAATQPLSLAPTHGQAEAPELMLFQDLPVVVAAGKREQTQRQAAASVSIVDSDDIQLFGYRSIADVLRGQRSFYLFTDGLNWLAGVRGFLRPGEWNARMMVLVDGRPTRETIYGQTHIDRDFVVPMETVKRVEIVRGPGSALYGSNAIFAVVNVVTKSGSDVNGLQLKLGGGTDLTGFGSVLMGKTLENGWDVIGSVSGFCSQGERDIRYDGVSDPQLNFGHIRNSDNQATGAFYVKAQRGDWTLSLDYANRYKDNRAATYLTSWFAPGQMEEERANGTAKWDHQLGETQSLHAMLYYGHYRYRQYWDYDDDGSGNPFTYYTTAVNDWVGGEFHYDWQATERLHVLAGADGVQSVFTQQRDYDTIDGELLDVKPSFGTVGAFAEVEYRAAEWLTLIGGGRVDYVQRIGTSVSPRAAAIITPNERDTFKLLYGRAFRAPNLYEMFYSSPGANTPNPDLESEVVDTLEAIWEREHPEGWRTSLNGYFWTMSDTMGGFEEPDGAIQTRNMGWSHALGVEAEVEKRWKSGGRFRGYATATYARDSEGSLTHSPAWITGFSAAVPIVNERTFLAIEPQIVGPQKSDLNQYTGPTFVTNVVFTSRDFLTRGLDFQLGAYNLFGEFARLPHSSTADHFQPTLNWPRTQVIASFTYKF